MKWLPIHFAIVSLAFACTHSSHPPAADTSTDGGNLFDSGVDPGPPGQSAVFSCDGIDTTCADFVANPPSVTPDHGTIPDPDTSVGGTLQPGLYFMTYHHYDGDPKVADPNWERRAVRITDVSDLKQIKLAYIKQTKGDVDNAKPLQVTTNVVDVSAGGGYWSEEVDCPNPVPWFLLGYRVDDKTITVVEGGGLSGPQVVRYEYQGPPDTPCQ